MRAEITIPLVNVKAASFAFQGLALADSVVNRRANDCELTNVSHAKRD
jgi:hypothetical protein